MTVKESALEYLKLGISFIPIRGPAYTFGKDEEQKYKFSKMPLLTTWKDYQTRLPTVEEVEVWFKQWPDANIAIVTGKTSNILAIDCDDEEALSYFHSNYEGTTVSSQSKKGEHFLFQHEEGVGCATKLNGLSIDIKGEGGLIIAPPSRIYSNGSSAASYVWLNDILNNSRDTIKSLSLSLYKDVVESCSGRYGKESTTFHNVPQDSTLFEYGKYDVSLFHTANYLAKGGMSEQENKQVLLAVMQSWGEYDEKWAEAKVKSAMDRINRKERNLMQEVTEEVDSTNGNFYSTEIAKILHLSTTKEIKNLHMCLKRLLEKNVIERSGSRNGCWRRIIKEVEVIDWAGADEDEYKIRFPLGIEYLAKTYPRNIILLAGASNTGKTAFMLETIRLNQDKRDIIYFNSEMGASELKLRLQMFKDVCPLDKWKFKAIERSSNFADVIEPDALNIIDFMEIYKDFWEISGWIKDVHEKLKTGIAIIGAQKKASTKKDSNKFSRGGEMTLEKPRIYIAMDRGRVELVKVKNWRQSTTNPNGMVRHFSLIGGWKFIPLNSEEWHQGEDEKYEGYGQRKDKDFTHEED